MHADTKLRFTEEVRRGGQPLGWCCDSSSLWCATCGHNYLWSCADEEVADNILSLLRLPRCAAAVERKLPGELEAALALLARVAAGRKPLGFIVLDNFSDAEAELLKAEAARPRGGSDGDGETSSGGGGDPRSSGGGDGGVEPPRHETAAGGLLTAEYSNEYGMRMLGVCVRGRCLGDVLSLEALAQLYARARLPAVAAEIAHAAGTRRCPSAGPDALLSRYLTKFDVEQTRSGWLTGALLGYPMWTTIARYHDGSFRAQAEFGGHGCG